jgi:hypothetical protein
MVKVERFRRNEAAEGNFVVRKFRENEGHVACFLLRSPQRKRTSAAPVPSGARKLRRNYVTKAAHKDRQERIRGKIT